MSLKYDINKTVCAQHCGIVNSSTEMKLTVTLEEMTMTAADIGALSMSGFAQSNFWY